jgi:hypothetical protein
MDEARAELKAYKRKAKAQRDNWKAKALTAEKELSELRQYIENIDAWYKELCELCGVPIKSLVNTRPTTTPPSDANGKER